LTRGFPDDGNNGFAEGDAFADALEFEVVFMVLVSTEKMESSGRVVAKAIDVAFESQHQGKNFR
jgi:hypothetical protein